MAAGDEARAAIQRLIVTGDNRLKHGGAVEKARESYEHALQVARDARLEDAVRPLVERRLADLERLRREADIPPRSHGSGVRDPITGVLVALDRAQRRRPWLAVPVATWKRFTDDRGANLGAVLAYYAFFSLFPLLLVFTTVLGYVLHGHPDAYRSVVDSALADSPVVGDQLSSGSLRGSGIAFVVGLSVALWSGLRVVVETERAFERIWAVPAARRFGFAGARVRALVTLVAVGGLLIIATALSGLVSGGLGGIVWVVAGLAVSFAIDLLLFLTAFRLLTHESVPLPALVPGIVAGAVGWQLLQSLGGLYVGHVVRSASATYGTFAFVIGLLVWLHLGARVVLLATELNVVLSRHLWPRGLT